MMKKCVLLISLLLIFLVTACKVLSKFTRFEMKFDETVTIPASTGINLPFNLFTPDIETNSESAFAINNTRKDLVEEVKLTTLRLTLKSPATSDFSFLKSISVFVSADDLPEIKIAWKEDVSNDVGKVLELDVTGADMQEYIKKDSFKLRLNTVTRKLLGADHQVDLHAVFFVDVRVLGL